MTRQCPKDAKAYIRSQHLRFLVSPFACPCCYLILPCYHGYFYNHKPSAYATNNLGSGIFTGKKDIRTKEEVEDSFTLLPRKF